MDAYDYQAMMDRFYAKVVVFTEDHPDILREIDAKYALWDALPHSKSDMQKVFFDWFVFDAHCDHLGENLLKHLLGSDIFDKEEKTAFKKLSNNICSIFEVKALRIGKEAIVKDLFTEKEYSAKDTRLTRQIQKGQCAILRVIPIHGYYILTGLGHVFPPQMTPHLKLAFQNGNIPQSAQRLSPLQVLQLLNKQPGHEKLSPEENFVLCGMEAHLEESYMQSLIETFRQRVRNGGKQYHDILQEMVSRARPDKEAETKNLIEAANELWNSLIHETDPRALKGPLERSIIHAGMSYVQSKVDPDRYKHVKNAEKKSKKLLDEWLQVPNEAFDGKSPFQVILEERKHIGNPSREVGFSIELTRLDIGSEIKEKSEALYATGLQKMKQGDYSEALRNYEEYCRIFSENHVAWNNTGVCHMFLRNSDKAKRCFEKALAIKPDYDMAARNLDMFATLSPEEIERTIKENRIKIFNKGKTLEW